MTDSSPALKPAVDAATSALIASRDWQDRYGGRWVNEASEAGAHAAVAVSAAFEAVVPGSLFITEVGDARCLWADRPSGTQYLGSWRTYPEEVWALLTAVVPTREETT